MRLPRRPRPPASNAELHAWNYGKRVAESGIGPPSVTDVRVWAVLGDLGAEAGAAYLRLGPDTFTAWANRAWWATHTSRSSA